MKTVTTILVLLLLIATMGAQSPETMTYQAVIRNSSDQLVTNQQVGMQISILRGSADGTPVYVETQTPTTNGNGLVSIEIGNGNIVSGDFASIDWANDTYYLKSETDPSGGTDYTIAGITQLLSVPYALHSKTADSITGTIPETDPQYRSSVASGITENDTSSWNSKLDSEVDGDVNNEIQDLAQVIAVNGSAKGRITDLTDPMDPQDAVTKSYVDSILDHYHNQILKESKHLTLWNELGSVHEVENSVVGPQGTIRDSVHFNNEVKYGKGITPKTGNANGGVDFPTTVVDPEKGCIEFWAEFYEVPKAYSYGAYGFVNVAHWSHNVMSCFWYNDDHGDGQLSFSLTFNGTKRDVQLDHFSPVINTPVHFACVWDRNGIDGSGDYMRIYVNGSVIASNSTENDWGTDNTSGNFRIATPWDSDYLNEDRYSMDNIKIWDFAKTDF
jgi:hypothetical protein